MHLFPAFVRTALKVVVLQLISDCIFCCVNNSKLKSKQWISFIGKSFNYYWIQNKYAYLLIWTYLFNSSNLRRNYNFLRASFVTAIEITRKVHQCFTLKSQSAQTQELSCFNKYELEMQAVVSVSSSPSRASSFYLPLVIGILSRALKSSAAPGGAFVR